MKKWTFGVVMCAASLLNGATFFGASLGVMQRGLDGIDNQASLLFIPFLWIIVAFVLVVINAYTLLRGIKIGKDGIAVERRVQHELQKQNYEHRLYYHYGYPNYLAMPCCCRWRVWAKSTSGKESYGNCCVLG